MAKDLKVSFVLGKEYIIPKDELNISTRVWNIKLSNKNIEKIKWVNDTRSLIANGNATINFSNEDNKKVLSALNVLIEKWVILWINKGTIIVNPQIKDFYSNLEEVFNQD